MKIATWNVNSLKVRLPHLERWLSEQPVDVLALQETKTADEQFPLEEIERLGYQVIYSGQKTYNGVAVLAKQMITDPCFALPNFSDPQKRLLAVTVGGCRVINVYVPNGSEVGSEKFAYKLNWLDAFQAFVKEELKHYEKLIVLGDFNIAPEAADVHDPSAWEGKVLFSLEERQKLQEIMGEGLLDGFRLFPQEEKIFSWWDYRNGRIWRNEGLRIDLVLVSKALETNAKACFVDKSPRKWQRPSDHAPVVLEVLT